MLGFTLSPEQLAEKERAHTFAEKIMRPVARKYCLLYTSPSPRD